MHAAVEGVGGSKEAHELSQLFDEFAMDEFNKEEQRGGLIGAWIYMLFTI